MQISVAQYHDMIARGVLPESTRIERLRGMLVEKPKVTPPHATVLCYLQSLWQSLLPNGFTARCRSPVTLADSEPEPDLAIAYGPRQYYWHRHPGSTDVRLIIEIASSDTNHQRFLAKGEIYAEAGIPLYWIVNLPERRVEVYSQPAPSPNGLRYAGYHEFRPGDMVPVQIDNQRIAQIPASELLPEIEG